ncbi:stage VI sporulation protein D [Pradoshia sp.]
MSPENTSYLRFSLEENVWFQSGQEVSELYSISLEPNVSVHEVEQYIILRGTLDLMGEYRPQEGNSPGEEELNRRYVSITDQREDTYEFQHHFPVDITVPAERVQDKNALSVGVQSFDYHLPEEGCLHLTAELWISGIQEELIEREDEAEAEEISLPSDNHKAVEEQVEDSPEEILIEAKAEEIPLYRSGVEEEEEEAEEAAYEEELTPFSFPSYPSFGKESSNDDDFYVEARIPAEQQNHNDEEFDEERDFLNHLPTLKGKEESPDHQSTHASEEKKAEAAPAYRTYQQEEYSRKDQKTEESKKESAKAEKSESKSLLYDLFTPEEETKRAKLKVYIVQGNETIDSLADRYQISAQHIARVNRIGEVDGLRAGQVIYIPVTASVNKPAE